MSLEKWLIDSDGFHSHTFGFRLDGLPPGVDPKGPYELTFTIVGGDKPLEVTTRLD